MLMGNSGIEAQGVSNWMVFEKTIAKEVPEIEREDG